MSRYSEPPRALLGDSVIYTFTVVDGSKAEYAADLLVTDGWALLSVDDCDIVVSARRDPGVGGSSVRYRATAARELLQSRGVEVERIETEPRPRSAASGVWFGIAADQHLPGSRLRSRLRAELIERRLQERQVWVRSDAKAASDVVTDHLSTPRSLGMTIQRRQPNHRDWVPWVCLVGCFVVMLTGLASSALGPWYRWCVPVLLGIGFGGLLLVLVRRARREPEAKRYARHEVGLLIVALGWGLTAGLVLGGTSRGSYAWLGPATAGIVLALLVIWGGLVAVLEVIRRRLPSHWPQVISTATVVVASLLGLTSAGRAGLGAAEARGLGYDLHLPDITARGLLTLLRPSVVSTPAGVSVVLGLLVLAMGWGALGWRGVRRAVPLGGLVAVSFVTANLALEAYVAGSTISTNGERRDYPGLYAMGCLPSGPGGAPTDGPYRLVPLAGGHYLQIGPVPARPDQPRSNATAQDGPARLPARVLAGPPSSWAPVSNRAPSCPMEMARTAASSPGAEAAAPR